MEKDAPEGICAMGHPLSSYAYAIMCVGLCSTLYKTLGDDSIVCLHGQHIHP